MAPKKPLERIKSGTLSRGFALAKMSVAAGAKAAGHAIGGLFAEADEKEGRFEALLLSQVKVIASELGNLKGSVMKAGQMLSMVGEHVLPPEVNAVLKQLQSQSPPLAWPAIESALKRRLGAAKLAELEISPEPWAAASLGQVHRAKVIATGEELALKIQYPGVERAIEGDVQAMRRILGFSKLLPKGPNYDELFDEVRAMLRHEVDYRNEIAETDAFREFLRRDRRYVVPRTFARYSTPKMLATSFETGFAADSPEVQSLSQDRRNALALAFLELYFRELFEFRRVQTDPHLGNYRVRLGENGEPDALILLDFGAVRAVPARFLEGYRRMIAGAHQGDRQALLRGAIEVGFLSEEDSSELIEEFVKLCRLSIEPFIDGRAYDFGSSDLPSRIIDQAKRLALRTRMRPPPRELVFLDRKTAGVFVFLSVLRARVDGGEMLGRFVVSAADQ